MGFDTLGLSEAVLKAIEESGYTTPTPIQAQAIPLILGGRDLIGASQTGTGKTAAFALPSLSKVEKMGKIIMGDSKYRKVIGRVDDGGLMSASVGAVFIALM